MNDRVKSLITLAATTAVEDISISRVRDCRFGIFDLDREGYNAFAWICLDPIEVEEPEGSGNKVERLWAHTNDWDGMVYGWGACEFQLITADRHEALAKAVAFLEGKFASASRIRVEYVRTPFGGGNLPRLIANSDDAQPALAELVDDRPV